MNKKLICLLLSVIMLLSVLLTSCGQKDDDDALDDITDKASASAVTLSMYLMSEDEVGEEQEKAIENAVNEITMAKFKAKMDLTFLTAEEYYEALEANMAEQAKNAHLYYTDEEEGEEETEPEMEIDDLGIETLKYPALRPNQVDIFYFSGYDKYSDYVYNDYLSMLNESVDGESKALNSYLPKKLLGYMKTVNDGIYAIPTNRPIGEYTYLLLNKKVLADMYYDVESWEFDSLTCENVQDVLEYVVNEGLDETYVPLHSFTGEIDVLNYQYWGVDENGFLSNDFSLLGGSVNPEWERPKDGKFSKGSFSEVRPVFEDDAFVAQYSILEEYKANGYYDVAAVEEDGKDFAVGYIKGGKEIEKQYGDKYEVVPVAMPTLYTQDLYENMFGVSSYTVDLARSMSVLTYLNTNEEFRNIFLYGVEGENYEMVVKLDEKGEPVLDTNGNPYKQVKVFPNNTYKMDINKTGNTLLAYTTVDEDVLLREYGKEQNRDINVAYTIGLRLDYADLFVHEEYFEDIRQKSVKAFEDLKETSMNDVKTALGSPLSITFMRNPANDKDTFTGEEICSFAYLYYTWLEENGMYVVEEGQE